ncbi:protein FAM161B [Scophthalmus maximus]|uniref:protein FAM161B n=1 Tax=Scophthalmus maximus TaxID=52904 RepID=UPI001FA931F0|nr:protein FAM161B [Scophthalmus maximus]
MLRSPGDMDESHRTNVLVTACLKTPVDPRTKAPVASYERDTRDTRDNWDNRDHTREQEFEDSGSDFCDDDCLGKGGPLVANAHAASGDRLDLSGIFFSNEEYYSKLEELKKAHLRTMAELDGMYRRKLQLKFMEPLDAATLEAGHRLPWSNTGPAAPQRLRKSHSAVELWRSSGQSDSSDEEDAASGDVEKGLLFSPKEHIKNMWRDFKLSPNTRHRTSSSLQSLPGDQRRSGKRKGQKRQGMETESWKHRVTVPRPFHMTLREAERRKRCVKTRSEVEQENAELRRQLEELTECQRKFRASPVPAHVHLPLYEELQERNDGRRRNKGEREERQPRTVQKPFSFLERERLKKEQKQLHEPRASDQVKVKPFKAKPVPKAVYAAASGELMKEEQLYRSIKIQMRAEELLHGASMPPSMLARRLGERRKTRGDGDAAGGDGDAFTHRPQINKEVPDFNASYRRFQKHLEQRKEVKPTTACEPFDLRTSQISSHRERVLADMEKEQSSPRTLRWPHISSGPTRTPNSSLCSSLSSSLELLPAKDTDATKKRHEAVRKALEQRRKAEEEEERWREKQKQREKKLQRVVLRRAQANDPHLALAQTHQTKLKEFRKQDLQRRKEYQQEIEEMRRRVKGRPLLLEQVAQTNAKQAAERRYTDALHGCDLTEEFISSHAARSGSASQSSDGKHSGRENADTGHQPVHYRKVFLDDEGEDDPDERGRGGREDHDGDRGEDSCHYSDDHEDYSDDSEHDGDAEARRQEAGE